MCVCVSLPQNKERGLLNFWGSFPSPNVHPKKKKKKEPCVALNSLVFIFSRFPFLSFVVVVVDDDDNDGDVVVVVVWWWCC